MTEAELQALMNDVVEMCDDLLEKYDWDAALRRHIEG